MTRAVSVARAALVCALFSVAPQAAAQSTGGGSAEAEELFQQGRAALQARDFATACARFSASLALERAVGTLISLAQCEEASGHLAGARQHWQEAGDLADATNDRLNRGLVARKKVAELDPRVPRIVVRLAAGAPQDTTVARDDVMLGAGAFGVSLPVDPGGHVLTVAARGHEARKYPVTAAEGEKVVVEVEPGAALAAPLTPPGAAPPGTDVHLGPSGPPSAHGGARRLAAFAALGLGVVGVGVGTYFGVDALSKWSSAKTDCGGGCVDGSAARTERNQAITLATVSTVGFVAGGVALGGAAWLFFAPSRGPEAARVDLFPSIAPGGGGLVARGVF